MTTFDQDAFDAGDPVARRIALEEIEAMFAEEVRAALKDDRGADWLDDPELRFVCLSIFYSLAWSDDQEERGRGISFLMRLAEHEERRRGQERVLVERDEAGTRVRRVAVAMAEREQLGRPEIVDLADELLTIAGDILLPMTREGES